MEINERCEKGKAAESIPNKRKGGIRASVTQCPEFREIGAWNNSKKSKNNKNNNNKLYFKPKEYSEYYVLLSFCFWTASGGPF